MRALNWQRKIYLDGFAGKTPAISPNMAQLEQAAIRKMTPAGVETVIRNLLEDLELTLGLSGCKRLADLTSESLRQV